METPSEDEKVTEDQSAEIGTEAAESADPGGIPGEAPTGDEAQDGGGTEQASPPDPADDELPTFKCHKLVRAFQIASSESLSGGDIRLVGYNAVHSVVVGSDYVDKHRPAIGGYYVRYHDGYQSWSPAKAFEDGYTRVD